MTIRFLTFLTLATTLFLCSSSSAISAQAVVTKLYTASTTELVQPNLGTSHGFRIGTFGQISRGIVDIANIIVAATLSYCAAAFVTDISTQEPVAPGDSTTFSAPNLFKTKL